MSAKILKMISCPTYTGPDRRQRQLTYAEYCKLRGIQPEHPSVRAGARVLAFSSAPGRVTPATDNHAAMVE